MFKKLALGLFALALAAALALPLLRGDSPLELGMDLAGGAMVTYRPDLEDLPEHVAHLPKDELLAMAKDTLSGRLYHRLDSLPDIAVRGDDRIVVSLPGETDQRKILETVGQTYRLTFRQVLAESATEPSAAALSDSADLVLPYQGRWLVLGEELLTGEMLDPASIRVQPAGAGGLESLAQGATISFQFRPPYDERFAEVTRRSIGQSLAILLDDRVEWAGGVEEEIRGPGQLRGGYTVEQASEVASLLRSGNLPLSLEVDSLWGVGPTLGEELSQRGLLALAVSAGLLALLILLAYGHRPALLVTGWLSLGLLLFFIVGMVSLFGLTLDLVAIAGLVLSVGMGMDAFILIFEAAERRRSQGGGPRQGIGWLRALYGFRGEGRTLVHANATTLLVVVLLFASDRLQSFALFLVVGILASLLTIACTRWMLEAWARAGHLRLEGTASRRGLLGWLRDARPEVFRLRRLYAVTLVAALLATLFLLPVLRPEAGLRLGADFQPGMQLEVAVPEDRPLEPVIEDLRTAFAGVEARHQALDKPPARPGTRPFLLTLEGGAWQEGGWRAEAATTASDSESLSPGDLAQWLRGQQVEVEGMSSIDARLSGQRLLMSLSVLALSFLFLGLYLRGVQPRLDRWLSGRSGEPLAAGGRIFVGTLLAVLLDIAVVLAGLAWLDIPLGLPVVAALLTIVGYSVNDSMVLWSHLSRPGQEGPPAQRIALGVDRVLSRAVLTSLSTLVPAVAILAVGLEPLRGFAWAVLIGTVSGTLSSLFVVASFALGRSGAVRQTEATADSEAA